MLLATQLGFKIMSPLSFFFFIPLERQLVNLSVM